MNYVAKLLLPGLFLFVAFSPLNAHADMFEKGFKLRAGGYWANLNSSTNTNILGTDIGRNIDYESDLGLEKSRFSPYLELTYRFNENHAVLVNYLSLHRDGTKASITKPFEFQWNGSTYQVAAGVRLDTKLNLDIYQTAYMYSFYSSDKWMLAGTLGAHVIQIENSYDGQLGLVSNVGTVTTSQRSVNESVTAPLPDFGLLAYYKTDYGAVFGTRVQYFQLEIQDVKGQMLDLRAEVLKYLDKDHHWGVGAAYQYYGVKVDYTGSFSKLDVEINYQGPSVFVQYDF